MPLSTPRELAEKLTITAYNDNRLNMDILDAILGAFAGADMEPWGSNILYTKDGKTFEQIVVEVINPEFNPDLGSHDDGWGWNEELREIAKFRWDW